MSGAGRHRPRPGGGGLRQIASALGVVGTLSLASTATLEAQDDGPRAYGLVPTGLRSVVPFYMHIESNMNPQQSILLEGVELTSDVGALYLAHSFGLGGRLAQAIVVAPYAWVSGEVDPGGPLDGLTLPSQSGLMDPMAMFRVGLIGAPALDLEEFMQYAPGFQLYGLVGVTAPIGDYEADRLVNFGTNRWGFRVGAPMTIPFGEPTDQFALELLPSVTFYSDNTDPIERGPIGGLDTVEQDPLFIFESQLTRNLTPELWVGSGMLWRYGGETIADGTASGNQQNHLSGGLHAGYAITRFLTTYGTLGTILLEDDGADGWMFRFTTVLVF
jgi:hypothetical protein